MLPERATKDAGCQSEERSLEMTQIEMTQAELRAQIIAKAGEDEAFRSQLLADPKAAVASVIDIDLPDALSVQVHEESATSFHLVLPSTGRMTEEELGQVFGGIWPIGVILAAVDETGW